MNRKYLNIAVVVSKLFPVVVVDVVVVPLGSDK
jgi:hypothetical protein